jgi:bifunctional DNA-binding transcriptional regulator/antitoxin component of YhaV-PrlF toxin-antitoxin module
MTRLVTAPLSGKGQMTLPKAVREALRLTEPGSTVGFLIDEKSHVALVTKMELVPAAQNFSKAELRKLLSLRKEPGGKTFGSMEELLRDVKSA